MQDLCASSTKQLVVADEGTGYKHFTVRTQGWSADAKYGQLVFSTSIANLQPQHYCSSHTAKPIIVIQSHHRCTLKALNSAP